MDQATKYLVLQNIPEGQSWSFFPALAKLFQLTHITNTGAAFGSFSEAGVIFKFVAIFVIIVIMFFYHHLPAEIVGVRISLGLIVGGAMGNLLDRFVRPGGAVVDFIDIGFWPIGNVADFSIIIGVGILAYYLWNEENQEQKEPLHLSKEGGEI
ncbi:signal peptidase II [Chloroflexota bacterium]